jgi:hypothetical protein
MEAQIQDLCQQIQTVACPEYFDQSTTESFRNEIEQCIQSTIRLSSSSSSSSPCCTNRQTTCHEDDNNLISHYDTQVFNKIFFYSSNKHHLYGNIIGGSNQNPGIQWGPLCKSHDSSKRSTAVVMKAINVIGGGSSRSRSRSSIQQEGSPPNTALEILLDILLNPSLVPSCFASTMIQGLFEVCVEVYSSFAMSSMGGGVSIRPNHDRPSSLKVLQCAIQSLLQRCPCAMVSKSIGSYLMQQVMNNLSVKLPLEENNVENILIAALESYSIERSLTALTVASDLVSMKKIRTPKGNELSIQHSLCRLVVMHQPLLSVLKEIDAMDIHLLECHHGRRHTKSLRYELCESCHSTIYSTKNEKSNKKIKTSSLSYLHGEASDEDDDFVVDHGTRTCYHHDRRGKDEFTMRSWKKIIKDKRKHSSPSQIQPESCYFCSRQNGEKAFFGKISALPLHMVEFRGILYQMFLDSQISSMLQMNTRGVHRSMMMSIFRMTLKYPMSASCRLCAILAADSAGIEEGYVKYTKFLLNIIIAHKFKDDASRSTAIDGVHIYRELLKECAVFDDPHLCWRSLVPLMDAVFTINEHHRQSCHVEYTNGEIETSPLVIELLKSIGIILAGKGSLIQNIIKSKEIHLAFNHYVVRFSETFGDIRFWIDGRMPSLEQSQVITCLKTLGILSFFDADSMTNGEIEQQRQGFWLYNTLYSARAAHVRMGPKVGVSDTIFSDFSFQDEPSLVKKRKYRSRDDSICEEPLMDYINDDLLRVIFSFLNYKVLVRATRVCKSWHAIGNENSFWQGLYKRRFKPIFLESLLSDATKSTIIQAFEAKHSKREDVKWKQLFMQSKDREESLGCKVSCEGWRHRYCRVFGCNVVLKKKDDEIRHMKVHEKDVLKKVAVIERAEARRLLKQENAKTKAKKTASTSSSRQTVKM